MRPSIAFFLGLVLLAAPGGALAQTANCDRLLAQLDAIDNGPRGDPARIAQYQDAIDRQRIELDRTTEYSLSIGCDVDTGLPQCRSLDTNIQRMSRNLASLQAQADRLAGGQQEAQRARVMASLQSQGCAGFGPAPGQARSGGGLLESIFGSGQPVDPGYPAPPSAGRAIDVPQGAVPPDATTSEAGGEYRTVCVRKCDGYFFPISYTTTAASFPTQEKLCAALCPGAQAELYAFSPQIEGVDNAFSTATNKPLKQMPNAFKFRTSYDPDCGCKAPGQSWATALADAERLLSAEKGDVIVTEEKSKELMQVKPDVQPAQKTDAKTDGKTDAKPDAKADAKPDAKADAKPAKKPSSAKAGGANANGKATAGSAGSGAASTGVGKAAPLDLGATTDPQNPTLLPTGPALKPKT